MWSPNVLKIYKILRYWRNSGTHVNAPNVFKIFKIFGYWQIQRCHNMHHSGIERLRVVIPRNIDMHATPVADHLNTFGALTWKVEFCQYPTILKIFNKFNALTSILKSEGVRGFRCGHQTCWKFSKFLSTDKIRVLTSMHEMYTKFPGTHKIRIFTSIHRMYTKFSKFWGTDKIWVFTLMRQMYWKSLKIFGYWQDSGIHVNARNLLKIFEILKYWQIQRCHNIDYSGIERLRVVIPRNIDTDATPVADHFEYIWCIVVNIRILSVSDNFENFE